jgi:hypothetical protein
MPERTPPATRPPPRSWVVGLGAVVWLGCVGAGFAAWDRYDATPGPQGTAAAAPIATAKPWTLTLYAHPHCPCTRAGLGELAELARFLPAATEIRVVFVLPRGVEAGWERTASWDAAAAIPGVAVVCDVGGAEAVRAGAATSGYAVLTDGSGRVAFRGGLTRGRGRVGESPGRRAILEVVAGGREVGEAPVFGCPLLDEPR